MATSQNNLLAPQSHAIAILRTACDRIFWDSREDDSANVAAAQSSGQAVLLHAIAHLVREGR